MLSELERRQSVLRGMHPLSWRRRPPKNPAEALALTDGNSAALTESASSSDSKSLAGSSGAQTNRARPAPAPPAPSPAPAPDLTGASIFSKNNSGERNVGDMLSTTS